MRWRLRCRLAQANWAGARTRVFAAFLRAADTAMLAAQGGGAGEAAAMPAVDTFRAITFSLSPPSEAIQGGANESFC